MLIVRGDTDFDRSDVYHETIDAGAYFAIGGRLHPNRAALVEAIAEERWKPFVPRADREEPKPSFASRAHGELPPNES